MNQTSGNNGTGRFEWSWNSSASFLYGGLAPIFGVIGLALLVVACSRCRRSQTESLRHSDVNKCGGVTSPQVNEEPNILVIVAGEEHPTHVAKPLSV
ncbi:GLUTAMINE DUMPER 4 [Spatholobus suberectus]|nr:GLUTAMINE DUMPER 4 [Spatholobus suberectus]